MPRLILLPPRSQGEFSSQRRLKGLSGCSHQVQVLGAGGGRRSGAQGARRGPQVWSPSLHSAAGPRDPGLHRAERRLQAKLVNPKGHVLGHGGKSGGFVLQGSSVTPTENEWGTDGTTLSILPAPKHCGPITKSGKVGALRALGAGHTHRQSPPPSPHHTHSRELHK